MQTFKIGFSLLLTSLFVGCASGAHLLTPQTAQIQIVQTNYVTVTNLVVSLTNTVTVTNGVSLTNTIAVTNTVTQIVTSLQTNIVTVTNGWQTSGTVSNIVSGAQMVNAVTAPVDPFSPVISAVLAAGLAAVGFWGRVKSKQAQQHLSTAQTMITAIEGLAPAVVGGVKTAVANQALKMGTSDNVAATVQAVTQNLPTTV